MQRHCDDVSGNGVRARQTVLAAWLVVLIIGAAALAISLAALRLASYEERSDDRDDSLARRYLDAFMGVLPDRSAIVTDGSRFAELMSQRMVNERQQNASAISLIPPDADVVRDRFAQGFTVFSPHRARPTLELQGFRFVRVEIAAKAAEPLGEHSAEALAAFDGTAFSLFRLMRIETCAGLAAGGWADVTELASGGRLSGRVRPGFTDAAEIVIYAARARALAPRLTASAAAQEPLFIVERFRTDVEGRADLEATLARDGIPSTFLPKPDYTVYRIALRASVASPQTIFRIDLGGLPKWTVAAVPWVDGSLPSATICLSPLSERALFDDSQRLEIIRVGSRAFFGDGWHLPEQTGTPDEYRWTAASEAEVMIPMTRVRPVRLRVHARPSAPPDAFPATIAIRVNETQLRAQDLRRGYSEYEWELPVAALREGTNQIFIKSSPLTVPIEISGSGTRRPLRIALRALTLELLRDPP